MSATVYITAPSPRSQATSDTFKQYGITNEIAVPLRETHVNPASRPSILSFTFLPAIIATALQASFLKVKLSLNFGVAFKTILTAPSSIKEIFTPAEIVTSFGRDDLKENIQSLMAGLGFRKDSTGNRKYYRGPATPQAIFQIVRAGGSMDTFAPYGATNIHGFSALRNLQRILLGTCAIWPAPINTENGLIDMDKLEVQPVSIKNKVFRLTSLDDMIPNTPGLILPYFDGMSLVDKTTVPSLVLRHFLYLFGNTQEHAIEAFKIFRNGWLSLSTTPQGIALTHLAYCVDMALQTGARPIIIYIGKVYGGVILLSENLRILKGNVLYKAVQPGALTEAIRKLDSHTFALDEILKILNPKLFGTGKEDIVNYVTPSSITSARVLHNLLRNVKLDLEDQKIIRLAVNGLKFRTKLWGALDNAAIIRATKAITTGDFLDDDAPIISKMEVLITKDPILSTLAAFGASAPTLIGKGTSTSVVISAKTMKKDMANNWKLDGFPVFVKPLQEAHEDWISLRQSSTVTMKLRLHSKANKPASIMGLGKFIPFDEGGDRINDLIAVWSQKGKEKSEKKRARALADEGGEDAAKRASKKSRSNKEADLAFAYMGLDEIQMNLAMDIDPVSD